MDHCLFSSTGYFLTNYSLRACKGGSDDTAVTTLTEITLAKDVIKSISREKTNHNLYLIYQWKENYIRPDPYKQRDPQDESWISQANSYKLYLNIFIPC